MTERESKSEIRHAIVNAMVPEPRAKLSKIEETGRRELIRDRVNMVGLVCAELAKRKTLCEAERTHFNRLVLRATDHVISLL
jgi:hypothetical protein